VVAPDINKSAMNFYTDYATNQIFWSLSRIKMVGTKAVDWIINEREKNGEFTSIINFIERVFKYKLKKYQYWDDPDNEDEVQRCPVNARHVLNLILAGCFDKVENAFSVVERFAIVEKAAEALGFEIKQKDFPDDLRNKHYFWSQQQIKVSGLGAIDYKRIYDNSEIKAQIKGRASYTTLKETLNDDKDGRKAAIAATIVEIEEKKFTSKKTGEQETFAKVTLQQNNDMAELVIWPEEYRNVRAILTGMKNKLIICMAQIKYSEYVGHNNLMLTRNQLVEII
jgi:DNA polymerase-3 subunit alpha